MVFERLSCWENALQFKKIIMYKHPLVHQENSLGYKCTINVSINIYLST